MTYTRQQVLDHYNTTRGTNYTLIQLGTILLTLCLQSELRQMLRNDAAAGENAQVNAI